MDAMGSSPYIHQTAAYCRDPATGPIRLGFEAASLDISILLCLVIATSSWPLPRRSTSTGRNGGTTQRPRSPAHAGRSLTSDLSLLWTCQSMGAITSQVIKMLEDCINCLKTSEVWCPVAVPCQITLPLCHKKLPRA
jgi:hypothetical protein